MRDVSVERTLDGFWGGGGFQESGKEEKGGDFVWIFHTGGRAGCEIIKKN